MNESAVEARLANLEQRVRDIEEVKPDVIAERVAQLNARLDVLVRIWISVLVAFVGAGISFAVWALQLASH